MSRSYRHSMIAGFSNGQSDKYFKQKSNRKLRKKVRMLCNTVEDFDDINFPLLREVSDIYDGSKDGKCYHKKFWLQPKRVYYPRTEQNDSGLWICTGFYLVMPTLFEQLKDYYHFFSK